MWSSLSAIKSFKLWKSKTDWNNECLRAGASKENCNVSWRTSQKIKERYDTWEQTPGAPSGEGTVILSAHEKRLVRADFNWPLLRWLVLSGKKAAPTFKRHWRLCVCEGEPRTSRQEAETKNKWSVHSEYWYVARGRGKEWASVWREI